MKYIKTYELFETNKEDNETANVKLIAPNGKQSNLSNQLYSMVRTPEFKAWFGDWEVSPETASKIVDENGEPMVVYHGTNNEFESFNKSHRLNYIHFAKKEAYAKNFGENIKGAFLNVRKLLDAKSLGIKPVSMKKIIKVLKFRTDYLESLDMRGRKEKFWIILRDDNLVHTFLKAKGWDGVN